MNIKKYFNTSFKNVLTLMSGTMISQIIAISLSPILTRLYTPEDYGLLGVFAAIIAVGSVIASGKFEMALLLPKKDRNAITLSQLCFRILFIVTIIFGLIFLLFKDELLDLLRAEAIGSYIFLAILSLFSIAGFNIYSNLLNRFKRYRGLAASKVTKTSGTTFSQLGFGFLGFGFSGLILGRIIGDFSGFLLTRFFLIRTPRYKKGLTLPIEKGHRELASEYEEFPKITAPHSFINTASASFPVLILSSFFSSSIVGLYTLCMKVTYLPITLISASTYQVFSQKVTELYNNGKGIHQITTSTLKKLVLLGFPPFLALVVIAPFAFAFVFGEEWKESGRYAQVLAPYLFLNFLTSPLAYLPILLKKQRKIFQIHILYLILRIAALMGGVYYQSAYLAISLYSAVGILTLLYVLFWYLNLSRAQSV